MTRAAAKSSRHRRLQRREKMWKNCFRSKCHTPGPQAWKQVWLHAEVTEGQLRTGKFAPFIGIIEKM